MVENGVESINRNVWIGETGGDPNFTIWIDVENDSPDSESYVEEPTSIAEEIKRSKAAMIINMKRKDGENRVQECLENLLTRLTNPNRDEKAGGTFEISKTFSCYNLKTNENNHIPASSCLKGTKKSTLSREKQLVITMFKEHHRNYPSTGTGDVPAAFRGFQRNLIINEGFARALEYEIEAYFALGLLLLYTFGWYDLLLAAFRDRSITRAEAIYLLTKILRLLELIVAFLQSGKDFANIDPKLLDEKTIKFSIDMQFSDLDVIRNLRKFLYTYIKVFKNDEGFRYELNLFLKNIKNVIAHPEIRFYAKTKY